MSADYELQDLVNAALEQKPLDFEAAFGDLLVSRLHNKINDKKLEIAQQLFNPHYGEDADEDLEQEEK